MSEPRMLPTSTRDLLTSLVGGLLLGFATVWVITLADATVPVTPWSLPDILLVLALGAVFYARSLAARVREARGSITPDEGVRALLLGKVMLVGGALLAGAHVAYVIDFLPRVNVPTPPPAGGARARHGGGLGSVRRRGLGTRAGLSHRRRRRRGRRRRAPSESPDPGPVRRRRDR